MQAWEAGADIIIVGGSLYKARSPEEAQEAFLMYSKAQENPEDYYKDLGEFYRYKRGQFGSTKGDQMGKRATRQGEIPSLVNVTSETETQKKDPAKEFWTDMKQFEKFASIP